MNERITGPYTPLKPIPLSRERDWFYSVISTFHNTFDTADLVLAYL